MLDYQEFGQLVPAFHHFVRVADGFGAEVVGEFAGGELQGVLFHFFLIGLKIVFQFCLGLQKVRVHGAPAGVNHIGHEVAHPEGALGGEFADVVVFAAEGLGDAVDAAVNGYVGYHGGIVQVEVRNAAQGIGQPRAHPAHHGHAALLAADGPFAEHLGAVGRLEIHGLVAVGRGPGAGADIGRHIKGGAFVVVAHVALDVAVGDQGLGLYPKGEGVVLREVPVQEGQVAVHHVLIVVMTEEAPDAGFAVADGAEVQRTVGFAEAEVGIGPFVIAHFAGEGDDIGRVHALAGDYAEA